MTMTGSRMRWALSAVALTAAVLPLLSSEVSARSQSGFEWSTFFIDARFNVVGEATFELVAVVECAAFGVWFGGVGGAIGGFACGLAGWG